MSEHHSSLRPPLITGEKSLADVTDDICAPMEAQPTVWWWVALLTALTALLIGIAAVWYQLTVGIGTW